MSIAVFQVCETVVVLSQIKMYEMLLLPGAPLFSVGSFWHICLTKVLRIVDENQDRPNFSQGPGMLKRVWVAALKSEGDGECSGGGAPFDSGCCMIS
jgi:hypothetical protein